VIKPFRRKIAGIDPLLAAEWNRMAKLVEGLSRMSVAPPLRMIRNQNGVVLTMAPGTRDYFLAEIVDDGPGAPENYTDQRYWVKEQKITNTGEADTTDLTFDDETRDDLLWVTATNLAEVLSETHLLPDNDNHLVIVFRGYDQSPIPRYYFYSLGDIDDPAVPDAIGVAIDGISDDAADADTWDRESPTAGKDGLSIPITCRLVYDHNGDEDLHGFYRTFTFDELGRLTDISAETEYTIDDPGACP